MYDAIIVGAGFSGSILARKLAEEKNMKVLVVEQRNHIAGNMYDEVNEKGILIQKYGPHFLNTNYWWIIEYLSQYSEMYEHSTKLLSYIDGKYVQLPFNFKTMQQLVGCKQAEILLKKFRETFSGKDRVSILEIISDEDKDISNYGKLLFEKAFKTYISKMWGLDPKQLDIYIMNRVPMALNYDERYLNKDFQYLPKYGFTKLFEKMLDHKNITIELNTNAIPNISFDDENNKVLYKNKEVEALIFTGMIDELFNYEYGALPYRSLDFKYETVKADKILPAEVCSYPQAKGYTRKTEYKWFNWHKENCEYTTVVTEYPLQYDKDAEVGNLPYYPIMNDENNKVYKQYYNKSKRYNNLFLSGRLAEYKYFNMDIVIEHTFERFKEIEAYLDK